MQIPNVFTGSASRLNPQSPPPGAAGSDPSASAGDGYAGVCHEKAQVIPQEEIKAPKALPEKSLLSKAVLVSGLAASAMTGLASTAGAAPLAAAHAALQTISTPQQNTASQDMSVHVLPEGTPRLDLIRHTSEGANETTYNESYSPVGVALGGGLFQDTHGNLGLVPTMTLGFDIDAHDFQRVDLNHGKEKVERFGNTVQFSESSTKRLIFTEGENRIELAGPGGKTVFEKNQDGSIHVKGPNDLEYTVKQEGLYTKIDRPGHAEISVVRSGDNLRVLDGNSLTGIASLQDGTLTVKGQTGDATVTRSENGLITEVKGHHGMQDARIVHDGGTFLGRHDGDTMSVDDKAELSAAKARYDSVIKQLDAVEPNFVKNHPVVASVLEYASANPRLLGAENNNIGFMQSGTLLASAGTGVETINALGAEATALNLANSARALGAAALSAQAAAQAQAAAGNLAQAQQLAQEAQGFANKAHTAENQAIKTGGKALKEANVARVLAGAGGALQIVDGIVGVHGGRVDRSLVEGAKAVTQASMEQMTAHMSGQDRQDAINDYTQVMKVMGQLDKQADKKVHVGELKIGLGGLMVVSALLGPEAPPILGAIGIAGTAGTAVYEHWGPIKSFLTGNNEHVPTFLDILPQKDEVVIHLDGVPKHR